MNTLNDQVLENVTVAMEPSEEGFQVLRTIPCPKLAYNDQGTTYTSKMGVQKLSFDALCTYSRSRLDLR